MNNFPIVPANKQSLACRKPHHGVGINDAPYFTQLKGRRCPFYRVWAGALMRCYCEKHQAINPTYKGCSVVKEWHLFSNFRAWMARHDWEEKELDKDLRVIGNKIYGPDTCIFIPHKINTLLKLGCINKKSCLPGGVSPNRKRFQAKISRDGRLTHIGLYTTPGQAHEAYIAAKAAEVRRHAAMPENEYIREYLLRYADGLAE